MRMQPWCGERVRNQRCAQYREQFPRGELPFAQRLLGYLHSMAPEDRLLAIDRQMVGEGRYEDVRKQPRAGVGLR